MLEISILAERVKKKYINKTIWKLFIFVKEKYVEGLAT